MKLQPITENNATVGYIFYCPGCKSHHAPYIRPNKSPGGASWEFNGNLEAPTFYPSILTIVRMRDGQTKIGQEFCILTDGSTELTLSESPYL